MISVAVDGTAEGTYAFVGSCLGIVWLALGRVERFRPQTLAYAQGSVALLVSAEIGVVSSPSVGLTLGLFESVILLATGAAARRTVFVIVGGLGLLLFVPQAAAHCLADSVSVALPLLLSGFLVIGVGVLVARRPSDAWRGPRGSSRRAARRVSSHLRICRRRDQISWYLPRQTAGTMTTRSGEGTCPRRRTVDTVVDSSQ